MGEIFVFLFVGIIYFIPSFVAVGKRNSGAIFALNLFLGWTFIGWVGALIWAIMDKEPVRRKQPLNYDTKLSYCPFCKVETKSLYMPVSHTEKAVKCVECHGTKNYLPL
jgi:hypothetical protein